MSAPNTTERLDLTDFEFDVPCQSAMHQRAQHTGAAAWIVTCTTPCGCDPRIVLACAQCLEAALASTETRHFRHARCGWPFVASLAETITKTEPLR